MTRRRSSAGSGQSGRRSVPRGTAMFISPLQLTALLILSRLEAASIFLPAVTVGPPTRDVWISIAAGAIAALGPLALLGWLSWRHDGACPVGLARRFFGKQIGGAIGVFLAAFFLLCASCTTRHVLEAYTSVIMPETPGLVFISLTVLIAAYAANGGAAVLGRAGVVVYLVALPLLLVVMVLPLNQMHLNRLLPVLDTPASDLAKGAMISFAFSMQAVAGAMLLPYLRPRTPEALARIFVGYTVTSVVFLAGFAAAVVAAYGPTASTLTFPVLSLARRVSIGRLIERVEIIPVTVWTASACMRIALFFWAAAASLTHGLGLARGRALMLPLGYLCAALTPLIVKNVFQMLRFYQWDVWGIYGTLVQAGLVVLLAAAYGVRLLVGGNRDGRR